MKHHWENSQCSERASETNSGGQKLRDGANINRSLLALANCINALGKQQKKGLAYVPYRNRSPLSPLFLCLCVYACVCVVQVQFFWMIITWCASLLIM